LDISQKELREVCVLSGTDYNCNNLNIYKIFGVFKKYKQNDSNHDKEFYNWLLENTDYINNYELLQHIYNMFDLNNLIKSHEHIEIFENIKIANGPINKNELYSILETDGFIIHL
jgi:hypothetical protein